MVFSATSISPWATAAMQNRTILNMAAGNKTLTTAQLNTFKRIMHIIGYKLKKHFKIAMQCWLHKMSWFRISRFDVAHSRYPSVRLQTWHVYISTLVNAKDQRFWDLKCWVAKYKCVILLKLAYTDQPKFSDGVLIFVSFSLPFCYPSEPSFWVNFWW